MLDVNAATSDDLVVKTNEGLLEGFEQDGVKKFFGIPFAKPPVGDLRWKQPVYPADSWTGVRSAKAFSAAPYQTIGVPIPLRSNGISEDCLYLNVWTKTTNPEAKLPVLVWFFGGGNLRGAGSLAHVDGTELAKLGAVVVNPNYRVGCFGFLNDEKMGGNFAVGDQIATLKWVHDNIESLGGDPSRVMIFGNSAGAVSVRSLLDAPAARGLFQRAFMQSAGFDDPANGQGWSFERSRAATKDLWASLGTEDPTELRAIPAEQIGAAAHPLSGIFPAKDHVHTPLNLVWMPTTDGSVVTGAEAGWADDVPLMVGVTENEARWSLSPTEAYSLEVLRNMAVYFAGAQAEDVLALLDQSGGTVFDKLDRLYTCGVWTEPAFAMMRRYVSQGRKIYYVHFARSGPDAVVTNRLAAHGAPVPYLFRTMHDDGTYDAVDFQISTEMMHALIEFANTGTPRSTGGLAWPSFDADGPRETLISDTISASTYRVTPLLRALNSVRGASPDLLSIQTGRGLFANGLTPATVGHLYSSDSQNICYETAGEADTTVVLIHGGLCDRSYWTSQIDHLARRHMVVALDLPGHGDSGLDRKDWSIEGFADDVVRVIDRCGSKRAVLVGHSMGALVAIEAARLLGSRAIGVVIVDMLHDPGAKFVPPTVTGGPDAQREAMKRGMFNAFSDEGRTDAILSAMISTPPEIAGAVRTASGVFDAVGALAALSPTPLTMVFSGSRPVSSSRIRDIYPSAQLFVMPAVGHFVMLEDSETFNMVLDLALSQANGRLTAC